MKDERIISDGKKTPPGRVFSERVGGVRSPGRDQHVDHTRGSSDNKRNLSPVSDREGRARGALLGNFRSSPPALSNYNCSSRVFRLRKGWGGVLVTSDCLFSPRGRSVYGGAAAQWLEAGYSRS
jgi:hypothetical protein